MHLLSLNPPSLYWANPCSPFLQQQDSPEPVTSNGEPFHFLPTAPDVLFRKGSPSMKKVIMAAQPDLLQSASKRQTSLLRTYVLWLTVHMSSFARDLHQ